MGNVIQLRNTRKRDVEKVLRVLLYKARAGEVRGFAFVALKTAGYCAGSIHIPDDDEALETAGRLMDTILGKEPFIEPVSRPGYP